MANLLAEYRAKYPQYDGIPDDKLSAAIYDKYYAGKISKDDFIARVYPDQLDVKGAETAALAQNVEKMGTGARFAAGMGSGAMDIYAGGKQTLGLASQEEIRNKAELDRALTNTTSGSLGNVAGKITTALPVAMVPGVNTAVGATVAGAALGLTDPIAEGNVFEGKLKSGIWGAFWGLMGNKAGEYIGQKLADRALARQAAALTTKAQTTAEGQAVGLRVPPASANPTITNKLLEGVSGKLTLAQRAAEKNQSTVNVLARKAIGLAPDEELSVEALKAIRAEAGKAYDVIESLPITIQKDAKYAMDLADVTANAQKIAQSFPGLADDTLEKLTKAVSEGDNFDPRAVVEVIKKFREDATILGRSAVPSDVAQGRAMRSLADSMDDLIERNLQQAQYPNSIIDAYRSARQLIAKTYTVQGALNQGTGNVVATKLGQQLGKKPLTGELETIAKFAKAYPKAMREVTESMPGVSPLDIYGSVIASGAISNPAPLAIPLARVGTREALLTGPVQNSLTRVRPQAQTLNALPDMLRALGIGAAAQ